MGRRGQDSRLVRRENEFPSQGGRGGERKGAMPRSLLEPQKRGRSGSQRGKKRGAVTHLTISR